MGDEIVKVNGFNISEAIHEDVLNLIKSKDEIVLKVTSKLLNTKYYSLCLIPYFSIESSTLALKTVVLLDEISSRITSLSLMIETIYSLNIVLTKLIFSF